MGVQTLPKWGELGGKKQVQEEESVELAGNPLRNEKRQEDELASNGRDREFQDQQYEPI